MHLMSRYRQSVLTVLRRLLKVDPLKCILCGGQMRFTGLKRGYRLAELVMMHEPLARQRVYS
ncbi:hypothetical protein VEE25_41980 (plasmid) [Escherichia coli]|nr:hypothetical protein VEE25_41980 [Escherichia coli]